MLQFSKTSKIYSIFPDNTLTTKEQKFSFIQHPKYAYQSKKIIYCWYLFRFIAQNLKQEREELTLNLWAPWLSH